MKTLNSRILRSLFIVSILLFGVSAMAQDSSFSDWDVDDDGVVERYEFTSTFVDDYFPAWNPENEKGIIEEGFFKDSYAGLDTDNDGFLSDEEWLIGYNYFYKDYIVYDDVDFIDVNQDGKISYDEYYDALYETSYFTDIDLDEDNYISEYELADFVFNNWDFNDSGTLSRSEFNRFDWYYLDV